ncbi:hypothetical protein VSH64_26735 [Amycolatopsis rhabdoformis]|uniref:Uncharacterized protein n=1 Tax=Amycolatopsis rhabdoformis TaxID=1448059 RepID=A0ABZ1HW73_9PSEU|nr:hypothetical protein [Amycolatopsis rhabdoformis]WSE26476.1 hypothetical protein VSH64_26735 [Amycolatopsis rhabdoformis]
MTTSAAVRIRVPAVVQAVRLLLCVVALSHVVVALVMWAREAALRNEIAAAHPDFGAAEVARSAEIAVASAAVFHAVLVVLCLLPAWRLGAGRSWARRLVTISQPLGLLFSVVSWSSSAMFHAVIPVVGALQIAAVVLLWVPAAREFFARARR